MQFIDLIRIAGITALLSLLWAGSIAFTYWDLHRRPPTGGKTALWLLLVVLLPLLGFAIYLSVKILNSLLPSEQNQVLPRPRRETALKRPAAQPNPTSTILASDIIAQTQFNAEEVSQAKGHGHGFSIKYTFTVTNGADLGKKFTVEKLPVYIGRDSDSLIFLSGDLGVSRKHAEIYDRDGAIRIRDLKSTHGTQVNGQRIDDKDLAPGDRIQVGRTILVVKADDG
jgi:hypothetical protein